MKMLLDKRHNTQISVAKGIGIILMVIGHSGCPQLLHDYIYLFHMALFYLASGYFYKENNVLHKKDFILKRIKGLYFPFVKWGFIFIAIHNLLGITMLTKVNGGGYETLYNLPLCLKAARAVITLAMPEPLLGATWFLTSLFVSSICLLLLDFLVSKIATGNKRIIITGVVTIVILLLTFIVGTQTKVPRMLHRDLGCMSLIYMGCILARKQYMIAYRPLPALICTFMLIITATTWGSYSLVDYSIRNPLIFCVCALMGWYSIMTLAQWIVKHTGRVARFCDRLGERTLSILIFHFCSFKLVSLIIILVYDLPISDLACFPTVAVNNHWWWIAYSVAGVGIPFLAGNYHGAFSRVVSKFGAGRQNNQ